MQETEAIAIIEVKRGVLEVQSATLQHQVEMLLKAIPHTHDNEFFYLSRENADKAMCLLQHEGIEVFSVEAEIHALETTCPHNTLSHIFGDYLLSNDLGFVPDQVSWKRYSFRSRRMLSARPRQKLGQWSLFLQEGQLVVAFSNGHFLGYYLAHDHVVTRCKNPQEALEACHWCSLPVRVYFETRCEFDPYVLLYPLSLWLPPNHYELLYRRLVGVSTRNSSDFVLMHQLDVPLARQILGSLGIELVEGKPPAQVGALALEIVETAADVTQQAYTAYLKSEAGVTVFEELVRERRWESIEPFDFQQLLIDLSNRAYDFDFLAEELLSYLIDRLPRSFDWKCLYDHGVDDWLIQGIILDRDTSMNFGPDTSVYYKIIVQQFGLVLGVMSKRQLLPKENGLAYFLASSWRVTPYAGRLKLTGAGSSIQTEQATSRQVAEEGYSHIYGIPSIEAHLGKELYLAAFFLDRDASYWRGHNEFSRYFVGHGRVVEPMVADLDVPATLFCDVFGDFFYLTYTEEQYAQHQDALQAMQIGQWFRFVAHVGLRSLLRTESDFPVFDLSHGSLLENAEPIGIAETAILGFLRYYGQLDERTLQERFQESHIQTDMYEQVLATLLDDERVVRFHGELYYSYIFCSGSERVLLDDPETLSAVNPSTRLFYVQLKPFLPMIHPLGYGTSLTAQVTSDNKRQHDREALRQGEAQISIVNRHNYQQVMDAIRDKIKYFGISVICVYLWDMEYALAVISYVRASLPWYEIEVQRKDMPQMYGEEETSEIWLRLSSPYMLTRLYMADQFRQSGIASRVTIEDRGAEWENKQKRRLPGKQIYCIDGKVDGEVLV